MQSNIYLKFTRRLQKKIKFLKMHLENITVEKLLVTQKVTRVNKK